MKKFYTHPELEAMNLNSLDIITTSTALDRLDKIQATQGGSDPSMEDGIDL